MSKYGTTLLTKSSYRPCATSNIHNEGNKAITGDSFHGGILAVLTTWPEVERSYEVEESCVMFIFYMFSVFAWLICFLSKHNRMT